MSCCQFSQENTLKVKNSNSNLKCCAAHAVFNTIYTSYAYALTTHGESCAHIYAASFISYSVAIIILCARTTSARVSTHTRAHQHTQQGHQNLNALPPSALAGAAASASAFAFASAAPQRAMLRARSAASSTAASSRVSVSPRAAASRSAWRASGGGGR